MFLLCSLIRHRFEEREKPDLEIEQGLETQRLRLLRLLAGLLAMLVLVSLGPVSQGFTERVRRFALSVLSRAEAAAQCLVMVQARLLAAERGMTVDGAQLLLASGADEPWDAMGVSASDAVPTLAMLRHRIDALRNLLRALPRRGLRLLRRTERPRSRSGSGWRVIPSPARSRDDAWIAAERIERPPDKTA